METIWKPSGNHLETIWKPSGKENKKKHEKKHIPGEGSNMIHSGSNARARAQSPLAEGSPAPNSRGCPKCSSKETCGQCVHSRSKWHIGIAGHSISQVHHASPASPASPFFCTFICTAATPSEPRLLCSQWLPSLSFQIELKQRGKSSRRTVLSEGFLFCTLQEPQRLALLLSLLCY